MVYYACALTLYFVLVRHRVQKVITHRYTFHRDFPQSGHSLLTSAVASCRKIWKSSAQKATAEEILNAAAISKGTVNWWFSLFNPSEEIFVFKSIFNLSFFNLLNSAPTEKYVLGTRGQCSILILLEFYVVFCFVFKFLVSRTLSPGVQQALWYAQGTCHHPSTLLPSRIQSCLEAPRGKHILETVSQKPLETHSKYIYNVPVLMRYEEQFKHLYLRWVLQTTT